MLSAPHTVDDNALRGCRGMESTFALPARDAHAVYEALEYYATDLLAAFTEDDAPTLGDAAHVREIAQRLQHWLVSTRVSLVRDEQAA